MRVSRTIKADAETLFRAWTDPQVLMHWWRMEGEGWRFAGASIDLRVGGRYRLAMTDPQGATHTALGVYREIQPPLRLAFTWDWDDRTKSVGETLVTVELQRVTAALTEVVVNHERFVDVTRMARHEQGWMELLRLLERSMEHREDRQ